MLATPRPIFTPLETVRKAPTAATMPAMPSTTGCALSDSEVRPRATQVKPWAAASVAGRMASPMLRIESSTAWPSSVQCCADVSRRSARFLSRIPVAFCESAFSSLYSPRFCA
ncbi:hypothetical protein D3C75_1147650 [compost metagenome]